MDVVSHWFWGVLVTRKHVNWKVAGPMAILLDIPSHTLQFFPTPVFFPLSNFHIDGTRWSTPVVLFTNVGVLVVLWMYVLWKDRSGQQAENQPLV